MANESIPEQQRKLVELSLDSYKCVWSGTLLLACLIIHAHHVYTCMHACTHTPGSQYSQWLYDLKME